MIRNRRNLVLDIFDYSGNKVCPLYDATADTSGQAVDVFVITERNGWRELSFTIPSRCSTENGEEENFRLKYLIGDYRIRLIDDDGVDWFQISEPKVTHSVFSKNVQVTAGHISQLLKTKNLGLEFTDKAGNNVGTAQELAATVQEGTGWKLGNVSIFYEKDGKTEKRRSLKASAKTGAFKQISKICDLFEAKPVYHGEGRTVDILPINPFSQPKDGSMPDISKADGVVELHYGQNIKNVVRKINTENLITKLYAYGSYGDDVSGYCGIDEINYRVANVLLTSAITAGQRYCFSIEDDAGIETKHSFVCSDDLAKNTILKYSMLDNAAMLYLWNENTQTAYRVESEVYGNELPCTVVYTNERNYFSFIMNFDYYNKVGLQTDEAVQAIAEYQMSGQRLKKDILQKTTEMNESQQILSETIGNVDFCKLNVVDVGVNEKYCAITISGNLDDIGVIYRTDYDVQKKDRFEWRVSRGVKPTGESLNNEASVMYIVHNTEPVTWEKVYLKEITNNGNTIVLTIWADEHINVSTDDRFYLFSSNNVNGYFGAYETADETCQITLENAVKLVTTNHPVYFSDTAPNISAAELNGYGWWVKYYHSSQLSDLYFCYSAAGDNEWNRVYCSDSVPEINNGTYWFDWKTASLYFCTNNVWTKVIISEEKPTYEAEYRLYFNTKLVESFSPVYNAMISRDKYYKGQYEQYTVSINKTMPAGNYYIADEYGTFFLFTTSQEQNQGDIVTYNTTEGHIIQKASGIETLVEAKAYRFDNVKYHSENIVVSGLISSGTLDASGLEVENPEYNRTGFISVYAGTYVVSNATSLTVQSYSKANQLISSVSASTSFVVSENTAFVRITGKTNSLNNKTIVRHIEHGQSIIANKSTYIYLGKNTGNGELKGLVPQMSKFAEYADLTYEVKKAEVEEAQNRFRNLECAIIDTLGDIYREGYWQTEEYVEGDEIKLYDDAIDNQKELSKPEASYTVSYLDLYGSYPQSECEETESILWPDLSIMSAAHLVDPDIDVNCWAYFDKISKCYDQPKKTTIAINTKLTTMGQHSFTDVLTHIAEVAGEVKGKESLYSRASAITSGGQMAAERLEGKIDANKLLITGGSSTWYTDSRGNQVFESTDGLSAMTLTGNGFAIANSKNIWGEWNWRTFGTGEGFTADEIITGFLSADRIETGSIGSGKLSSEVNNEIDKIAGIESWVEDAKITLTPQKITSEVVKSAEFSDAVENIVSEHTYIQYTEPQGEFQIGDIWIKTSDPSITWETLKGKTWKEVKESIWGSWGSSEPPVTHIWDGSSWLVTADFSFVSEMRTTIEQTSEKIAHMATKDEMNTLVEQTAEDIRANVVYKDSVISAIMLSQEEAYILAPKIRLEGLITANGNFIVKEDGSIEAANATISGNITAGSGSIGGWEIGKNRLSSGTGENCVVLSTEKTVYAIWAGADAAADAPFSVTQKGALRAKSGSIAGWTIEEGSLHAGSTADKNYVALSTANETYAIWAGRREAALAPFSVTRGGYLKSTSGLIGGWSIGTDSLYAGSGSNKVALSTNVSSEYAIWAGADEAVDAPFIVKKDGTVYVDKIIARTEEDSEIEEPVSLRNDLWKLNRAVEKLEVSDDGKSLCIKLYASKEINFNKASDFEYLHTAAAGSGSNRVTITVKALTELAEELGLQEITATMDVAQKRVTLGAVGTAAHGDFVNCEAIYNAGWNECVNSCIETGPLFEVTDDQRFRHETLFREDGSVAGTNFCQVNEVYNTFYIPKIIA